MFVFVETENVERRDPRGQGDLGELIAAGWFVEQGAAVFTSLFRTNRDDDFIIDWRGRLERVQVKTTTHRRGARREVTLCTRGGNRSRSG